MVVGELNTENDSVLVAKGGEGGSSATDYKPTPPEKNWIVLDLKLIGDIGLVGCVLRFGLKCSITDFKKITDFLTRANRHC